MALIGLGASVEAKPTLWLIGDSTVKVGTPGQQGWGTQLPQYFNDRAIRVENRARGGMSSRTYLTDGLWAEVLEEMKSGDYVLMQFGHNDSGPIGGEFAPGRAARASIEGNDDASEIVDMPGGRREVVYSYGAYLRKYVRDAKGKGAYPIIISPIPKRGFIEGRARRDSGKYAGWAEAAARQVLVPLLDLNSRVADAYDAMGEAASLELFDDNVHTNSEGAALNARCVAEGVEALRGCNLKRYLVAQ